MDKGSRKKRVCHCTKEKKLFFNARKKVPMGTSRGGGLKTLVAESLRKEKNLRLPKVVFILLQMKKWEHLV